MAILSLNRLRKADQVLLAVLTCGLLAFIIFIEFIATKAQLRFIGAHYLDKIAHIAGGIFLAVLFSWLAPRSPDGRMGRRIGLLVLFIGVAAIAWEGYEFFFDADTAYFYHYFPDLWRLDAAGDIVAAYLGGYGYWVFAVKSSRKPAP